MNTTEILYALNDCLTEFKTEYCNASSAVIERTELAIKKIEAELLNQPNTQVKPIK